MKALATEMTANFTKRLAPLQLKVRELTGDTTLTRKEIAETQVRKFVHIAKNVFFYLIGLDKNFSLWHFL